MIRTSFLIAALALGLFTLDTEAGGFGKRKCHRARTCTVTVCQPVGVRTTQVMTQVTTTEVVASPQSDSVVDPYGFLSWINHVRMSSGRGPVVWDPEMSYDAAINSSRGFGHHGMGRATAQNVGSGPLPVVEAKWLASPAHAIAIYRSDITRVGLAYVNGVWTYDAR